MKKTLWSKNFTIITLGTIISSIGGVAMSFALGYVVFDTTGSTLLSACMAALNMVPRAILPVLISPYLDRAAKKPILVGLDFLLGAFYLFWGVALRSISLTYSGYLLFSFFVSCVGSVYQLTFTGLYPKLVPEGFAQKGYTVSGMIYPTVMVVMTPLTSILYLKTGLWFLCIIEGSLLMIAALLETQIKIKEKVNLYTRFSLKDYCKDIKEAIDYFRKEKGLLRIYAYMPLTQGIGEGCSTLIRAWFVTTPSLGLTLYALLTTVQFVGRTIGGVVHYMIQIPEEKRFTVAYFVYQAYNVMDALLLWLGYPLMMFNQGICGFLGINSATLRESSVQNYIPDTIRTKLNSLFTMAYAIVPGIITLIMGACGEFMDYRICVSLFSVLSACACYGIIYRGKKEISAIYNQIH